MSTIQQDQANLEALAREVASEKAAISGLKKSHDEAVERGDDKQAAWALEQVDQHKEVLKAAENILAEEAGVATPRARRGRPPLQKRAE